MYGLRPRLDDEELTALAVLGPFHVHGLVVVLLDDDRPASQGQDLVITEHQGLPFLVAGLDEGRRVVAVLGIDHLLFLAARAAADDRHTCVIIQQRLEDQVFVGVHHALDHGLAQAPGAIDQYRAGKAGVGIDTEHDT